jgi:hypothetical protein
VLAMAQIQLGLSKPAHDSFANAMDEAKRRLPQAGDLDDEWNDWINVHVLTREAVSLIPDAAESAATNLPEKPAWQQALANSGFKVLTERQEDGTWEVDIDDQPVTNISMLHDAPVSRLTLMHTAVADLTPLRGMALKWLRLAGTKVKDLSPLQGMPLESLQISGTPVTDLSPLRGMPLQLLNMTGCRGITNLEPLREINTFQTIILPPNAKDLDFLRSETNIERISFKYDAATHGPAQTAAEFWAQQDEKPAPTQP